MNWVLPNISQKLSRACKKQANGIAVQEGKKKLLPSTFSSTSDCSSSASASSLVLHPRHRW
eukprot:scaffold6587_cov124-Pinguiococcus_pyrenoidosus.AAC.2